MHFVTCRTSDTFFTSFKGIAGDLLRSRWEAPQRRRWRCEVLQTNDHQIKISPLPGVLSISPQHLFFLVFLLLSFVCLKSRSPWGATPKHRWWLRWPMRRSTRTRRLLPLTLASARCRSRRRCGLPILEGNIAEINKEFCLSTTDFLVLQVRRDEISHNMRRQW